MEQQEYLDRLHKEILIILNDVVRVCNDHGLKYYLIGGTLLGAVRHKGFIPWDDDLDIVMPREDFELFTTKYYKHLHEDFSLEWFNTNPKYNKIFAKVTKNGTVFEELIGDKLTTKRGIFIDIFPMDITSGYGEKVEKRKKKVMYYAGMIFGKSQAKEKAIYKRIIYAMLPAKALNRMALHYMKGNGEKNGKYYSNFGSQYGIKKQTHLISDFGDGVMLPFEEYSYCAPVNYTKVLESIFGKNYMELPPESERKTHYPVRVLFSDGKEAFF